MADLFDSYHEINRFNYQIELKKVRSRLITIAILLFLSDLLGLLIADMLTVQLLLFSMVIPAVIGMLAFLAFREPMAAMVIAAVIIGGLWIYLISVAGARGAVSGFLVKAIVIYLLVSGFQSAGKAQRLKKDLGNQV